MRAVLLRLLICLLVASAARSQSASVQTPGQATVTIGSKIYRLNETATFVVKIEPAPRNVGKVDLICTFRYSRPSSPPAKTSPLYRLGPTEVATANVPMRDGVSEYAFSLPIERTFKPGIWELSAVTYGEYRTPLTIGPASFEVSPPPPVTVSVSGPQVVKAGETANFRLSFDTPIKSQPCYFPPKLTVEFHMIGNAAIPPVSREVGLLPEQANYEIPFDVPPYAPNGEWELIGVGVSPIITTVGPRCLYPEIPPLQTNEVRFKVLRSANVVVPTSAEITINPSQIQLLRTEAALLRSKEEELRKELDSEKSLSAIQSRFLQAAKDARANVEKTESSFNERARTDPKNAGATIFFDDLKRSYDEILAFTRAATFIRQPFMSFLGGGASADTQYSKFADAVLLTLARNAEAYSIVADEQTMEFDLEVRTDPDGATVAYYRTGDQPEAYKDPTTCRIHLVRAKWHVRLEKAGFEVEDKIYDANADRRDLLFVKLTRKRGGPR